MQNRDPRLWPTVAVLALHASVTVYLALSLNLWIDEAYSLHSTSEGVVEAFRRGIGFERQAPLYFVALGLWRSFNPSPESARLLSVLVVVATLVTFAAISRRLFPSIHPAWGVALLGSNSFLVWAATEIRVYALNMLLCTLILYSFFAVTAKRPSRKARFGFVLVACLGLYTHYYLGIILAGLAATLVLQARWKTTARFMGMLVVTALLALPILTWLPDQMAAPGQGEPYRLGPLAFVQFVLNVGSNLVIPGYPWLLEMEWSGTRRLLLWAARLGFVAIGIGVLSLEGRLGSMLRDRRALVLWFLFIFGVAGLGAGGVLFDAHRVGDPRYWSFLVVPATLALLSIVALMRRRSRVSLILGAAILLNASWTFQANRALAKRGDSKRVCSFLEERESQDQPILVFPNEQVLAMRWYYRGVNELVPVPRPVSLQEYDLSRSSISGPEELAPFLKIVPPGREAWIVRERVTEIQGVPLGTGYLENFVAEHFSTEEKREFYNGLIVEKVRALGYAE